MPLKQVAPRVILLVMTAAHPSFQTPGERTSDAFTRTTEPFRRELKLHSYRMLGSLHEAEDAVQETYLRAWRGFDRFDFTRGSMRAWLYRIATNVSLNLLAKRKHARRLLPDIERPSAEIVQVPTEAPPTELLWLEPYPDSDIEGIADDAPSPEARYVFREAVQLAFVAAIQQLPPRQRAAILLCDVLGWTAAETAELLGASTASINSALQRARATLAKRFPGATDPSPAPARPSAAQQRLLERYVHAWEAHDVDAFVALVKEDAIFTMPPWPQWYAGREDIRTFFAEAWLTCGGLRLVATRANAQPAFAVYERSGHDGLWHAQSIQVLALDEEAVSALTIFVDARLFESFGLPTTLGE